MARGTTSGGGRATSVLMRAASTPSRQMLLLGSIEVEKKWALVPWSASPSLSAAAQNNNTINRFSLPLSHSYSHTSVLHFTSCLPELAPFSSLLSSPPVRFSSPTETSSALLCFAHWLPPSFFSSCSSSVVSLYFHPLGFLIILISRKGLLENDHL